MRYRLSDMVAPRMSPAPQALPADRIAQSWVDRVPHQAQPWLRLMRLDRPIGAWLLFLPCVFGLALADRALARLPGWNELYFLALFGIGAIVMRGAGCTYNDIVDRDIDAAVARTRGRPIPSGAVSVNAAWVFLAVQCAAGLLILLQFNLYSVVLGAASLLLIAAYPFMKRITWWPQAWLGLTFNWGALVGYSAVAGRITLPALFLYAGCFFWTIGYDTIYAHQDKDDDALIGVKSTARLFGDRSRPWIAVAYALTIACLVAAVESVNLVPLWLPVVFVPTLAHLFWQIARLETNDAANCLKIFRANRDTGFLIAAALVASAFLTR